MSLTALCPPFYVAGVKFHEYREYLRVPKTRRSSTLTLLWNRTNPHDPLAIKVMADGPKGQVQIGWVPRNSPAQRACHECREAGTKVHARLLAVKESAPPYDMFLMQVMSEPSPRPSRRFDLSLT